MTDMTEQANMPNQTDVTLSLGDVQNELSSIESELAALRERTLALEARREEVAAFKAMFESFVSRSSAVEDQHNARDLSGMSIVDGTVSILRERAEWIGTRGIIRLLAERGLKSNAENPYTSVFGILNRDFKRTDTQLAKENGRWGLREWLTEGEEEQGEHQGPEEENQFEVATFT